MVCACVCINVRFVFACVLMCGLFACVLMCGLCLRVALMFSGVFVV